MKSFFKTFLASFLGSALLLLLLIIIPIVSLISSLSSSDTTVTIKPQSILYMTLDYEIPERTDSNDLGFIFTGSNFKITDNAGMNDIINNIKAAAIDENISGIGSGRGIGNRGVHSAVLGKPAGSGGAEKCSRPPVL